MGRERDKERDGEIKGQGSRDGTEATQGSECREN